MKKNLVIITLLVLTLFGITYLPLFVSAETQPPNEGDWIIGDHTTISDRSIILKGNLIVHRDGELNLYDVDLKFNCESNGQYKIKVENGGRVNIYNTEISSNTNYYYTLDVDTKGELNIINSTVTDYTTYEIFSVREEDIFTFAIIVFIIAIIIIVLILLFHSRYRKSQLTPTTTIESLVGKNGFVLHAVKPDNLKGKVRVKSRIWSATAEQTILKGKKVKVVDTRGINIVVEELEND